MLFFTQRITSGTMSSVAGLCIESEPRGMFECRLLAVVLLLGSPTPFALVVAAFSLLRLLRTAGYESRFPPFPWLRISPLKLHLFCPVLALETKASEVGLYCKVWINNHCADKCHKYVSWLVGGTSLPPLATNVLECEITKACACKFCGSEFFISGRSLCQGSSQRSVSGAWYRIKSFMPTSPLPSVCSLRSHAISVHSPPFHPQPCPPISLGPHSFLHAL